MVDFFNDFVSLVFELIQGDWFAYSFIAFTGLFSVYFILNIIGITRKW